MSESGIDYGKARIGVALSDELQMLAHPIETIAVAKTPIRRRESRRIAQEKNVERIVRRSAAAHERKRRRIGRGSERFRGEIEGRWSPAKSGPGTSACRPWRRIGRCGEAGKKTRQTRGYVDQVAAQMILQGYLDSLPGNQGDAGPATLPNESRSRRAGGG